MRYSQAQNIEYGKDFYKDFDLRKYHRQSYRNVRLNRKCENVIRNGEPITLTLEQRELFTKYICDVPKNSIGILVFCGMIAYVCMTWMLPVFVFVLAYAFKQTNESIANLLYVAGIILVVLILAGFVGLCIMTTRKNKKRTEAFQTEAREKIRCGDFRSYSYQIEAIYRVKSYDEEDRAGYLHYWYRVGDVLFELPDTICTYKIDNTYGIIFDNPEKPYMNDKNYFVGGNITGMLIHLAGQDRFYAM